MKRVKDGANLKTYAMLWAMLWLGCFFLGSAELSADVLPAGTILEIRLLTPLTASDLVLKEGMDILEAAILGN